MTALDLALLGGRVIDPETGLDARRNVGIAGGRIVAVTEDSLAADRELDVSGLVVAPGFIDLHSHAQTLTGARLQAFDGVTTALELEAGTLPVTATYEALGARPINAGYSASWALARLSAVCGLDWSPAEGRTPIEFFEEAQAHPRWGQAATDDELAAILALLETALDEGAIGIGVLLGYAPATAAEEFAAVVALAARRGVPVFTHSRTMSMVEPGSSVDGIREIVGLAESTGAHVHVCHLNSTSLRQIEEICDLIVEAQARGVRVTTETYPYGAGSTGIGADFFAPERFARLGTPTTAITYLPTGERVADLDRLRELRAVDPGGLCIIDVLDPNQPDDLRLLLTSVTLPGGVIASDAMPLTVAGGHGAEAGWPVPAEATAHPRSAGAFARTLAWLVRDLGVFSLGEALARMTLGPARILEAAVPEFRSKGRVQEGADADVVVFDPDTVADTATFGALGTSLGFRFVIVDGVPVIDEGRLVPTAEPGTAIRRPSR